MISLAAPTGLAFEDAVATPERAACRGRSRLMDPSPQFRTKAAIESAKSICRACPVLAACRAWVLSLTDHDDPGGITAALTEAERARRRGADQTPDGYKRCRACAVVRPLAEFYRDCRASDGRQSECTPCQRARNLNRYHATKGTR